MPDSDSYTGLEIAIIGLAGKFPGASDIDAFWENLKNGVESISFFSDEELLSSGFDDQLINHADFVKAAGVIEGKEYFDSWFFGYLPDEASAMDPQIRLFHQCVWEALEDAGYNPTTYEGAIGLYAGAGSSFNWEAYSLLSGIGGSIDGLTASQLRDRSSLAVMVSYKLNLKGPSFTLHTACSTSLVAAHLACQALICGECDIALAGGVTLMNSSQRGYIYREGMILSQDGHCRTFDVGARGLVAGEGAAVTVLKPLDNAVKEGDNIHAIIKGSYVNNDGVRKVGYTAPSVEGQAEVIRNALSAAAVEPESITYIETHGTGTVLGDPIEVEALNNVFAMGKNKEKHCALGALKTNTGHMDTAAGAASLIKTVLALKHRRIPPSLHFNTPNPKIDFENSPFYVNTTLKKWENHKYPLRAGVSSFGIGGTNVHIVLEQCPETYNKDASSPSREYQLIVFSAKTSTALHRMTANLRDFFEIKNDINLADAVYTLQTGRQVFPHRRMFACKDTREAVDILSHPDLEKVKTFTFKPGKEDIPIVFMFSGQGGQYVDMGLELYRSESVFRNEMDRCFEIVTSLLGYNLKDILYPSGKVDKVNQVNQTEIIQPLLFVFEYALAKLIMDWGIAPDAMIGYSYGEFVAACLAGVFSLEDAIRISVLRGQLMKRIPPGAMLSVPLPEEELVPLLKSNDALALAVVNGPSCIVSGPEAAVAAFERQMKQQKRMCIRVGMEVAGHSQMMAPMLRELEENLKKIKLNKPEIPYISNVSGTWIKDEEAVDPGYWARHMQSTVRFAAGLQELLTGKYSRCVLVEIGPGKSLCNFVRQQPAKTPEHLVINLIKSENERVSDLYTLLDRLGRMWLYGVKINWEQFYSGEKRRYISLPTYPFDRIKYPVGKNVLQMLSTGNAGQKKQETGEDRAWQTKVADVDDVYINKMERPELVTAYVEPSTPTQQALVEMWRNFFGIAKIGTADDFFELGGDSLKAMTLLAKIHQQFDVEILLTGFFANSTIKDLASLIDSSVKREFEFIEPVEEKEYYPLSSAQKRLFILQEMVEGSTAYNLPQFIPFGQDVDIDRLEKSFKQLIQRHESLRTSFHMVNNKPIQRIQGAAPPAEKGVDFDIEHETDITAFIRPFDLSRAPLMRVGVVKADKGNYLLMVDMHHIISDGVSLNLLEKEFKALYRDPDIQLPELRLQYKDYSEWQHREEWQETLKNQEKYWLNEFPDELPVLNLIADFQRPLVQSFEGSILNFYLGEKESAQLKKLAQTHHVTFYMALLSLFIIFLSKLSGQEDIIVGTGAAGRRHPDLEKIIGMFVNTLPLRSQPVGTKTLATFLEEIKNKSLYAFENQEYPFEDLIEKIDVPRDTSRNPLFDVLFILQSQAEYKGEIPEDTTKITHGGDFVSKFDITLNVVELDNGILFSFEYCTKIFSVDTMERFAGYLKRIISSVIRDPEQRLSGIDILTPQVREQLIYDFNDTYGGYSADKTLHELFEEQAARTPHHTAVVGREQGARGRGLSITYNKLNEKSNQLAQVLRQKGVQPDAIVGLKMERSIEMITGILGILKAGGAYLPIDPEYPRERMDYMLKDSNARVLVNELSEVSVLHTPAYGHPSQEGNSSAYRNPLLGGVPEGRGGSSLAYVIYTSGTTGKPKGNLTTHRNVVRVVKNTNYIDLAETDRVLQLSNYAFDGSVFDIYGALLNGAALVLVGKEEVFDVDKLSSLITRENITLFFVTTALFNTLVDLDIECLRNVRKILFGGERVSVEHTWRALEFLGKDRIMHMYGPTETTVYATSFDIDSIEEGTVTIPIGGPISRTSIYILNENLNPQPIGVKGEIYIGGDGLARGYLNHPELTAEKFVSVSYRSYRTYISKKIYKTGDLARWLQDGSIEFIGRIDKQVKIRGFRVEPGEIENRLLKLDEIKEAVVTFSANYLCAYYVIGEETVNTPGSVELKEYLSHTLPNYMIPTHFIRVEKMPLNPNGKIDIKLLPAPTAISDVVYAAPENEVEKRMVEIWSEVLDQPHHSLGIDDNFFDLGGHSLKATIMAAAIHKEFNVKLPLEVIFRESTIRKLSQTIEGSTETQYASIKPVETREYYLLSSAQKRMYVLQQMNINNTSYNILAVMPIEGRVDRERLEETFRKLIKRHENFRTSFNMLNGQPVQRVHQEVDFEIEYYNLATGELPAISDFIRPFDLSRAPLLRVGLTKLEEKKHLLMADMHHIISDGTSQQILTRDFLALYIEHEPKPLRLQYKDFSIWQDALFASGKIKNQEKYWLNLYEDEIPKLDLPVDYPRPGIFTFAGGGYQFNVDKEDTRQLRELGKRNNTTTFMNIMAVFNVLLYKYTTQDDIVVGSAVAGRPHADLQGVIGMFVNMLPIRNYPKGSKRFIDFAAEVREHSLKAFENQDMQFEELIDQLNLDRDPSRNPLFDISMVAQNFDRSEWRQSTRTGVGEEIGTSKFDITLFIMETPDQVQLSLEYYKGIFKDETIKRFAGHLLKVLHQVVENPFALISDLTIIGEEERQMIIYEFNRIETGYTGDKTIHELFENQAARTPGHTAVVGRGLSITYNELNEKSNRLAYVLRQKGVQPDTIVGLMVERSIEMIIGILGILKAGGAYLPIDPEYPDERKQYMLTDSGAKVLLTNLSEGHHFHHSSNQFINHHSGNLAYVIYTSGTTGNPKGTLTTHQNAVRVVKDTNYIELKETDRILQLSNYAFDGSVFDIYGALLNGAALVLVGKEEVFDVDKLSRLIERESITLFFVTTALFNTLVDLDIGCLRNVRKILFGGERVSVEHTCKALKFLGRDRLAHMYGPTETTVYASYYNINSIKENAVTIPIGGPISNTVLYVLDENLTPQPVGLTGEIYIGGEGVARGYLNNPELTSEKFFSVSYKSYRTYISKRIYKTGDLGRWLQDGSIEFIGRTDSQVKIRGFRIEPVEVESQLLKHDEIKEAVIVVKEDERRDKYLCAYYVAVEEAASDNPGSAKLKEFLSQTLPNYMIPTHFVMVEKMPLNPNGKVDIKALPEPAVVSDVQYAAPASAVEKKLAKIWLEVLGSDRVGIDDNFFELGGQSIKAAVLAANIHQAFNVKVPLAEIFRNPTVRGLASFLEEAEQETFTTLEPAEEKEFYELSYNQKRLWILNQLAPKSSFYNMPEVTSITRSIDVKLVKETLKRLVQRHESLRTAFMEINGQVRQVIKEKLDIDFEIFDISTLEVEEKQERRARLFRDTARAPFDLSAAPLFRLALIKLAQEQYDLVFNMHHIITDGWSMNILKTEFSLLYESCRVGKKVELKPLILQYRDFTEWTNKQLNDTGLKNDSHRFWKERLEQGTPTLELQRDFNGNREDRGGAGYRLMIDRETRDQLKKLSRDYNTSLFMVMFSVYIVLLARFSGLAHREEIACSIISSGREHLSLQNIIGFFVNSLIFKTYVDYEENFVDFLRRLHLEVMEIFQHQDYPVELVCDEMMMRYPEIPVSFNFINLRDETGSVDMASFDSYHLEDFNDVKFDIEPYIKEYKNGIDIFLSYRKNMFKPGTIEYMMNEYTKLLEFFSNNPGKSFTDYKLTKKKKTIWKKGV